MSNIPNLFLLFIVEHSENDARNEKLLGKIRKEANVLMICIIHDLYPCW